MDESLEDRAPLHEEASLDLRASAAIIATVTATAAVGGLLATPAQSWYRSLDRPAWQPPDWAFGPVWTVLYALAAGSAISTWHRTPPAGAERRVTFALYGANAALNAGWTGIFFRARRLRLATIESAALTASTVMLIARTRQRSRGAACALVPYAAWTAFATVLSGEIARRNS